MRSLHLTYIKALLGYITLSGQHPFAARFFEVRPPVESFEELVPFAVLAHRPGTNRRDGRRFKRLANGSDANGRATARYLRREYDQVFSYQLDFWVKDPAPDVLSDPRPLAGVSAPPLSTEDPGIIDQAVYFMSKVRFFTDGTVPIIVTAGQFGTVDDPAGENALYKHFVQIEFRDGLYSVEEFPTLDQAVLQMQPVQLA